MSGEAIDLDEPRSRLSFIQESLKKSANKCTSWLNGSVIFYLVLMTLFLFYFFISEKNAKALAMTVFILVTLGLLGLSISPLRGLGGFKGMTHPKFFNTFYFPLLDYRPVENVKGLSDAELGKKLHESEELLRERAAQEQEQRAWPNRTLSLVVVTIANLVLWLVFKAPKEALMNQIGGMIVSQAHISLSPNVAIKALKRLERP